MNLNSISLADIRPFTFVLSLSPGKMIFAVLESVTPSLRNCHAHSLKTAKTLYRPLAWPI